VLSTSLSVVERRRTDDEAADDDDAANRGGGIETKASDMILSSLRRRRHIDRMRWRRIEAAIERGRAAESRRRRLSIVRGIAMADVVCAML
jgi:hypothetical protein